MNNFPIIFINRGNPDYLYYALEQAKKFNKNNRIIVIGDESNKHYLGIEHYLIDDYYGSANNFKNIYQHLSNTSYEFELFCFQRWFILNDFIKKNKINNFFYTDCDLMIFCNILLEAEKFKQFDLTLSQKTSPHSSFWYNQQILENFCLFLDQTYSRKNNDLNKLENIYKNFQDNNLSGGVCDMTLLNMYAANKNIGETTTVINNSFFDHNININNDSEIISCSTKFKIKKIYWINNLPYVKNIQTNKFLNLKTIHCQGKAKLFMKDIFNHKNLNWITIIKDLFKKVKNYV